MDVRKPWFGLIFLFVLLAASAFVQPLFSRDDALREQVVAISAEMAVASGQRDAVPVTLYFRYMQTDFLAQEARVLEVARNETVELAIVRELMAGPGAGSLELTPLFSANDRLLAVRLEDDQVTVILGAQFLDPPADAPQDWEQYEYWAQEVPRRRRLAIQAVTNALTEGGRCHTVRFLVSTGPEDTQGARVRNAPFFGGDPDALLPPQARQEEVVLTPRLTLNVALDAWQRKDWLMLYAFLLRGGPDGTVLPSQADFMARIGEMERSLLHYRLSAGTVSVDGATATLLVTARLMRKDGQDWEIHQVPVAMVRERGSWKLPYDTLLRLMREQ